MVLILGSYDHETKPALVTLKSCLASGLMSEEWTALVVLVDDIDVYKIDVPESTESLFVISETAETGLSLFVVRSRLLVDAVDMGRSTEDVDHVVAGFVSERYAGTVLKLPILDKVTVLASIMQVAFLVRHVELTRGGEYIELAYLIGLERASGGKLWFLKREGFELSSMAWEILDKFGVQMRSYINVEGMCAEALRVVRNLALRGPFPPKV